MTEVYIAKRGFEIREWDPEVRQMVVVEKPQPMIHYLRQTTHIESDVTLADLFLAVDSHPDLIKVIQGWCWCDVRAFHAEALSRKPGTKQSGLTHIEISKYIELDEFGGGEYIHVSGVGPLDKDDPYMDKKAGEIIDNWAIDFTPVSEMADCIVRLRPKVNVYRRHGRDAGYKSEDLGEYTAHFTLLDVMEIYYEISFHGSPASRDERSAELFDAVAEIKAMTEEERAERLVPLDEILPPESVQ